MLWILKFYLNRAQQTVCGFIYGFKLFGSPQWEALPTQFFECIKGGSPLSKEIKIILRLFLVIAMYCQGSSSQIKSITQPLLLLAGWEGSLGTCSR